MINPRRLIRSFLVAVRLVVAFLAGRLGLAFLLAILAAGVFAYMAHNVREGDFSNFDSAILSHFRKEENSQIRGMASVYTRLGDGPIVGFVTFASALAFALYKRFWPDGVAVLTAGCGGFVLIEAIKALFGRPRPEGALAAGLSFPSGHSFLGLAVYGFLANRMGIKARWWLVPCLLVGATRPIVGVHYPTDVLAGWAAGGCWLLGCLAFPQVTERESFSEWRLDRAREFVRSRRALTRMRHLRPALVEGAGKWGLRVPVRLLRRYGGDLLLLAWLARRNGHTELARPLLEEGKRLIGLKRE